jgi:hypothetical protein
LIPESPNTTPNSTPTVAIEVALRRSTIQAISNHRIPETRNSHQYRAASRTINRSPVSM